MVIVGIDRQRKIGGRAQCLNFFSQPRQVKLFLSQNLVNVFHAQGTIDCSFLARQRSGGGDCNAFIFASQQPKALLEACFHVYGRGSIVAITFTLPVEKYLKKRSLHSGNPTP
jgi:hypothetical protein